MADDHEITVVLNPYKDHTFSDLEKFMGYNTARFRLHRNWAN